MMSAHVLVNNHEQLVYTLQYHNRYRGCVASARAFDDEFSLPDLSSVQKWASDRRSDVVRCITFAISFWKSGIFSCDFLRPTLPKFCFGGDLSMKPSVPSFVQDGFRKIDTLGLIFLHPVSVNFRNLNDHTFFKPCPYVSLFILKNFLYQYRYKYGLW